MRERATRGHIVLLSCLEVFAPQLVARAQSLAGGPPPAPFTIDWPGTLASVNPRAEEHALALFEEDEWNRASVCPLTGCEYTAVATLAVGAGVLWLGVAPEHSEHDGMYSYAENLVVIVAGPHGPPRVAHTLVQWEHKVPDCYAEVHQRRQRVADLDHDGETELCIESVSERGAGLFQVMDLGERHQRWYPAERSRGFSAWSLDTGAGRLIRRSTLDARCPRIGYRPFVPVRPYADAVGWRAGVQGADRAGQVIGAQRVLRRNAGCGWPAGN